MLAEKKCSLCGVVKPADKFNKRPTRPSGLFSRCKDCERESSRDRRRAHYVANRERLLERQNTYAAERRESERERSRAWRAANKERVRELNQQYYADNRAALLEQKKDYAKRKPEIIRANNRLRKARRRGALGSVSPAQWREVVALYAGRCAYCGSADSALTQDHVIPVARGGSHYPWNIVPACMSCNCSKKARTPTEWGVEWPQPLDEVLI